MRRPLILVGAVGLVTVAAGILVATNANAGTTTYEAESATNTVAGGARSVTCRRCSGGKRVGWVGTSGVLTFKGVTAERGGSTTVNVTYSTRKRRTALLAVNGGTASAISFPSTRGFGRPSTLRIKVTLRKGSNTLAFGNPSGWAPDFDKLVVATDGTPPPPVTAEPTIGPTGEPPAKPPAEPTATPTADPNPPQTSAPATNPPTPPSAPSTTPPARPTTTPPTAPTKPPATPEPDGNAALEAAVVDLVNVERAKAGCPNVTSESRLTLAARAHSADQAARNYFSHTTPEGVSFATRITNAGYTWRSAGENIAKGQRTPAEVMNGWMNSSGHKANILNCGFKDLGVGVAADARGTLIWTQNFATAL